MYKVMNMSARAMTQQYSIADARRNLPSLIREAENGRTVELTRRGEPVAVLVGCRTFEQLSTGRRGFVDAYRDFKEAVDLKELALDPDELFEGTRDKASGRDIRF